jgi:hypothetical protein
VSTDVTAVLMCIALPILGGVTVESRRVAGPAWAQEAPVNADARSMAAFGERVKAYVELRKTVLTGVPRLSDQATPIEIDRHQRELLTRMSKARAGARQGDLFTPDMQAVVRTLMKRLFATTESRTQLRASVMDENPTNLRVAVNGRYPDTVPLSTMPPEVLRNLPRLPEELEFRFVGTALILLDPQAHMVVDFVPNALPR